MNHFPQCKRKPTISNFKQYENARMHIVKQTLYMNINQIPQILYISFIYYRSKVELVE